MKTFSAHASNATSRGPIHFGCCRAGIAAAALLSLAPSAGAAIIPPALDLSALGGSSAVSGMVIAGSLDYPYGAAVASNGNILFGTNSPQGSLGITDGPTVGSIVSISPQAGGTFTAPVQVVGGINGTVQSVNMLNTAAGQDLVVDSGFGSGRTITIFGTGGAQIGQLQFTYASTNWWHPSGVDTIRQMPDGSYQLFFGIGSEADQAATSPGQVTISGLGLSTTDVNADSVYELTLQASGNSVQAASGPLQVVSGVRNAYGLQIDAEGDLIVGDNGQDGAHDPFEVGADTLNIVPAAELGNTVANFGFPDCFTSFYTGQQVGCTTPPLEAFLPTPDANGMTQYSEGLSAMACVPAGQMWFVGSEGGCFIGFHGATNATGAGNPYDAFLYYDFASGKYTPILDGGAANVGHWDTLAVSGDNLIVGDLGVNGWVDYNYGSSGYLAEYTLDDSTQAPEPASWIIAGTALVGCYAASRRHSDRRSVDRAARGFGA